MTFPKDLNEINMVSSLKYCYQNLPDSGVSIYMENRIPNKRLTSYEFSNIRKSGPDGYIVMKRIFLECFNDLPAQIQYQTVFTPVWICNNIDGPSTEKIVGESEKFLDFFTIHKQKFTESRITSMSAGCGVGTKWFTNYFPTSEIQICE